MHSPRSACLLLAALVAVVAARAENVPPTGSLFVSALAGPARSGDRAGLADNTDGAFLLGFRWTDRVSGEVAASRLETSLLDPARTPADLDTLRVNALWHYFRGGRWHPYAVAGIGQQTLSAARREDRGSFLEGGLGVWRHVIGPLHFRLDTRAAWSPDRHSLRGIVAAGITIAFGGGFTAPADPAAGFPR